MYLKPELQIPASALAALREHLTKTYAILLNLYFIEKLHSLVWQKRQEHTLTGQNAYRFTYCY